MKKIIIIVLVGVLLISTLGSCAKNDTQTSGLNTGWLNPVHEYEGWIYYTVYQEGIYKVRANGEDKTLVIDKTPYWFEIYEDRIYYAMFKDGDIVDNSIYSCKLDGSDVTFICESTFDLHKNSKFLIEEDWIYYSTKGNLIKVKIDGSGMVLLNEDEVIVDFTVNDGWVYYTDIHSDELATKNYFHLNRVRTDGKRRTQLTVEGCRTIELKDDWIYYIRETGIYRARLDGSLKQKLTDCAGGSYKRLFKVIGDWVYYEDNVEGEGIYKVKTDGSKKFKLTGEIHDYWYFFNVWENWLVYIEPPTTYPEEHHGVAHLIRLSSTCETDAVIEQILEEIDEDLEIIKYEEFTPVNITHKYIEPEEPTPVSITHEHIESEVLPENDNWYSGFDLVSNNFVEHDGFIYYSEFGKFSCEGFYRIRIDGTQKEKLCDCTPEMFCIYEDRIYVHPIDGGFLSLNLDGSDIKDCNFRLGYLYRLFAEGDRLYMRSSEGIYSVKPDTKEIKKLSESNQEFVDLSVSGGYIYYIRHIFDEDWGMYLFRMKTDGTGLTKLTQSGCMSIDYDDEWIYYIDQSGKGIYKMKMDGSDNQKLTDCDSVKTNFFKVFGDWVYYENNGDEYGLYKVNTKSGQSIKVLETHMNSCVGMGGNWLINVYNDFDKTPYETIYQLIRVGDIETTDDIIKKILEDMQGDIEIQIVD